MDNKGVVGMTLNNLLPGQKAVITGINKGEGAYRRLLAMGVTPGSSITMLARHPFRGPLTIEIGHSRIALGREIASAVEVSLETASIDIERDL